MKLYDALELGKDCGLETVRESISNIELHCGSIFLYTEINKEFEELYADLQDYNKIGGSLSDNIYKAMKILEGIK